MYNLENETGLYRGQPNEKRHQTQTLKFQDVPNVWRHGYSKITTELIRAPFNEVFIVRTYDNIRYQMQLRKNNNR